ncbi:MAG: hypothetical protein LE168_01190 [Endomicrobium sp.]|nr:hypothetical protein [Endomicrobium sp.]
MAKRLFRFVLCFLLAIFASGCGENGNIFSWTHRSGSSSSSDSLMSDAASKMKKQEYAKAADLLERVVREKPGDEAAVMKYASACIADTLDSNIASNILTKIVNNNNDISDLSSNISDETINKADKVFHKLVKDPDMFPLLFGANPPISANTNFSAATIYIMSGIFSAANNPGIKQYINADGFIDINRLSHPSDNPAVASAVRDMKDKALEAVNCLNNIERQNLSAKKLKSRLEEFIRKSDSWLADKE